MIVIIALISCNNNRTSQAEIDLYKFKAKLAEDSAKQVWLEDRLAFESEMLYLMNRLGYSTKRSVDSIISLGDKQYLTSKLSIINPKKLEWYKEHREYLLTLPQQLDSAAKGKYRSY